MANLIFELIFSKADVWYFSQLPETKLSGIKKRDGLSTVERYVKIKESEHTTISNCWDNTKITIQIFLEHLGLKRKPNSIFQVSATQNIFPISCEFLLGLKNPNSLG